MPRFERSRERKGGSRGRAPRSDSGSRGSFRDRHEGRGDSDRRPSRDRRERRDFEMTKVTCDSCGVQCEVPFKPTSSKPVYCNECFGKKGKRSFNNRSDDSGPSEKDFDIINEKLNKIMAALKIKV